MNTLKLEFKICEIIIIRGFLNRVGMEKENEIFLRGWRKPKKNWNLYNYFSC